VSYYIYIARTANGYYYTGITTDFKRRLRQHNGELSGGAKALRGQRPVELVWAQGPTSRSQAAALESNIKGLTHQQKEDLVNAGCEVELP
jgi:putative endonuclease